MLDLSKIVSLNENDSVEVSRNGTSGIFAPLKLNVESLGNQVPHLHWHLFPRRADDPEKLKPVWLALDRADRDLAEKVRLEQSIPRAEIAERIRAAF